MKQRMARVTCLLHVETEEKKPNEYIWSGIMYEGLTSQVDWSDLSQVVEIWEKAKGEILVRLGDEKIGYPEFENLVDSVIRDMGLPSHWSEQLKAAVIKLRPEIEQSLVISLDEWPSIPPL